MDKKDRQIIAALQKELLARMAKARQHKVQLGLPDALDLLVVSVEAGTTFGWERWADVCLGIDRFGASAPGGTSSVRYEPPPTQAPSPIVIGASKPL